MLGLYPENFKMANLELTEKKIKKNNPVKF